MTDMSAITDMLAAYSFIVLIVAVLMIASMWKIFEKAGKPGWAALIPIYNTWVLFEITWGSGVYMLLIFASIIPLIGFIVSLVVSIMTMNKLAKLFGKDIIYTLGLIFLPVIFLPMLAFGKDNISNTSNVSTIPASQPTQAQTPAVEQPAVQPVQTETPVVEQPAVQPVQTETPVVEQPAVQPTVTNEQPAINNDQSNNIM